MGQLDQDYQHFLRYKSNKSKAKFCHSTVRRRIVGNDMPEETSALELIALPTLHILLGVVNRVFKELVIVAPIAEEWPKALHLHFEQYHNGMFEGNECKKLLDNLPRLRSILEDAGQLERGKPFINILDSYANLNKELFQPEVNIGYLEQAISSFAEAWEEANLAVTTKVHIVVSHLADFVRAKNGKNIAMYSEQSHEAIHCEFAKIWSRYLVKETTSPSYIPRLLKAVLDFNGTHGF